MDTLLDDLHAFYLEHERCGELDGGVEGEVGSAKKEEARHQMMVPGCRPSSEGLGVLRLGDLPV